MASSAAVSYPNTHNSASCSVYDNSFGPRVGTECRDFDFTLLFEDAIFVTLPAALLLLLVPLRLLAVWKRSPKTTSYQLAICKQMLLFCLLVLHTVFLVLGTRVDPLRTKLSLASQILQIVATLAAGCLSFLENQRSLRPSDLLVLYFSACTVLFIPKLRSLWLLDESAAVRTPAILWTLIFSITIVTVAVESFHKYRFFQPSYKDATAEQIFGFWGKSLFIWVLPLFRSGYSNTLQLKDIPNADPDLRQQKTLADLNKAWCKVSGKHRLFKASLLASRRTSLSAIPARLSLSAFTFCQPFLIGASVSYLRQGLSTHRGDGTDVYAPALVGAFVLVYVGIAVSRAIYWRQAYRMVARMRSGLSAKVYYKTMTLHASELKDSAGVTLMGTDVERIVDSMSQFHELWASFVEVGVGVWLLARQISYAALVPLAVCVLSIIGAGKVASSFGPAQKAWNQAVQRRIATTVSTLNSRKAITMLGLLNVTGGLIKQLRATELKISEKFRALRIWRILIANTPTTFAPFVTFAAYAGIAAARKDESLLAAQAFTALSLISILTNPLLIFCQSLPTFKQALSCFERIEEYLMREDAVAFDVATSADVTITSRSSHGANHMAETAQKQDDAIFTFNDAAVSWGKEDAKPVLNSLNLKLWPGFTAITGSVASGKSTLLASMLGETILARGSLQPNRLSRVAYCSQTPWIMNASIRDNITGWQGFDEKWYAYVIWCCGLQNDIARFPGGDDFLSGSQGSALSGGQRQRVALARAVYSKLPVLALDDITSGLDSKTVENIAERLFSKHGHLREAGIHVIFATNNRRMLQYMDDVVVLQNGRSVCQGSFSMVAPKLSHLRDELPMSKEEEKEEEEEDDDADVPVSSIEEGADDIKSTVRTTVQPVQAGQVKTPLHTDTSKRSFSSLSLYQYYFQCTEVWTIIAWAAFTVVSAFTGNFQNVWIEQWTEANEKRPNQKLGLYIGIYAFLVSITFLCTLGECWFFFINVINQTATKMHADLLDSTTKAPFHVFQKWEIGSVTNRFSQDMDLIDMRLPTFAIQFTTGAASSVVMLIILCVMGKYLAVSVPALAAVLFFLQRYYLRTSQQVRLIDIETKAPLYKHYIETAEGVATIRSFGWTRTFHERLSIIIDRATRPFYMLFCMQQWLQLILDLIVGSLAVIIVAVATSVSGGLGAGSLGVALTLILQFNTFVTQTIQAWVRLETAIGAVHRVQTFIKDTPSEPDELAEPAASWPSQGDISIQGLTVHYNPNDPPALAQLSLNIAPGAKIAVCGPSGSGKTTLLMSILQMVEVKAGTVYIDGVDVSSIRRESLRSTLNIVPQDPFFLPRSVRFNLDAHSQCADDRIEWALREVGLWKKITAIEGEQSSTQAQLNRELEASTWSHGERQLLCLARALLHPSKIVILDEAASSVDEQTEATMQGVIERNFGDRTVISIIHRFSHINYYDRVAVLKDGRLREYDSPMALMRRDSSLLRELRRADAG